MDAVKYLKEKERATKGCSLGCPNCILGKYEEYMKTHICTEDFSFEEAVKIIEKWSNENPEKTILQYFIEQHPNAPLDKNGTPKLCPFNLGYTKEKKCLYSGDCVKCWNRPMEE